MTDQLEGAELELAVAKVRGLKDPQPSSLGVVTYVDGNSRYTFTPLTSRDQRMEVQDWVRAQGYDVFYYHRSDGMRRCVINMPRSHVESCRSGPDDAHALLRAVVEMGR